METLKKERNQINKIYRKKLELTHKKCLSEPLSFEIILEYFMMYIQQMRDNTLLNTKLNGNQAEMLKAFTMNEAIDAYNNFNTCVNKHLAFTADGIVSKTGKTKEESIAEYTAEKEAYWEYLFDILKCSMKGWEKINESNI